MPTRCAIAHEIQSVVDARLQDLRNSLSGPQLEGTGTLGKGRRDRALPLWKETKAVLNEWFVWRCGHAGTFRTASATCDTTV